MDHGVISPSLMVLFVWPVTGFINHDDESKHGNICEVNEDHECDDDRTMMKMMIVVMKVMTPDFDDNKNSTGEVQEHIKQPIFENLQPNN